MHPKTCSTQALIADFTRFIFLASVAKRMIASTFFVDQTFEATEIQEIRKALT